MDGYFAGSYQIESVSASAALIDYKDRRQNLEERKKKEKKASKPKAESHVHEDLMVHTSGYGRNGGKQEFSLKQHEYM